MKKKQIFIIQVDDMQNQSWQGSVEWVNGHQARAFRSVMELLRLMDSALLDQDPEAKESEVPFSENKES